MGVGGAETGQAGVIQIYRCYTAFPRRPRIDAMPVTETEDIAASLDVARNAWPELADEPGALLRQPIFAGEDAIQARLCRAVAERNQSIERISGMITGGSWTRISRRNSPGLAIVMILDASVLIAHLESGDGPMLATDVLLENCHDEFAASAVNLAEVFVGALRAGRVEEARSALAFARAVKISEGGEGRPG